MLNPIRRKISALFPSCRTATALVSAAQDRPLTLGERYGLKLHLALCLWCRRYSQQVDLLQQAVKEMSDKETSSAKQTSLSPEMRLKIQQRLEAAIDEEQT